MSWAAGEKPGWDLALALCSSDRPAGFPLRQGHSAREEIVTEDELSGKKAATFTGTLLPRCVFGLPGEKVTVCHVLQVVAVAPAALLLPGLLAGPESQGLYFNIY